MNRFFKNYSLSIILLLLFAVSLAGQAFFNWREYATERQLNQQTLSPSEYFDSFMGNVLENWQSDFLQLVAFIILATYFIHKGSPQSRDGDDQTRSMIRDIQHRLDDLDAKVSKH